MCIVYAILLDRSILGYGLGEWAVGVVYWYFGWSLVCVSALLAASLLLILGV